MRLRFALAMLIVVLGRPCVADDSTVTLSLAEYEKLRGAGTEQVAVVDTIQLGGTFRDRGLVIVRNAGSFNAEPSSSGTTVSTQWPFEPSGVNPPARNSPKASAEQRARERHLGRQGYRSSIRQFATSRIFHFSDLTPPALSSKVLHIAAVTPPVTPPA